MLDVGKDVCRALSKCGDTYYDMFLANQQTPCISYYEETSYDTITTEAAGVSSIVYVVKVWATDPDTAINISASVDKEMRKLGFIRIGSTELNNDGLLCKIIRYRALGFEIY